jgi:hypothetical protein
VLTSRPVPALFLGSQYLEIADMPYPAKVEVVELLPLPFSRLYGSTVVLYAVEKTISFSLWVIGPSATRVSFRLHASPPGDATPICAI